MEKSYSYYVQVFPSTKWKKFKLLPGEIYQKIASISREPLLEYIHQVLAKEGKLIEPIPSDIQYQVRVLRNKVKNTHGEPVPLAEIEVIQAYKSYLITPKAKQIEALLNSNLEETVGVAIESFRNSRVIIIPAIRDIARYYYKLPTLPASLGYEVSILEHEEELEALLKYNADLITYNNQLIAPLYLATPTPPLLKPQENAKQFTSKDKIVFLAKRGAKIIGFCLCDFVRYRDEIDDALEQTMDSLFAVQRTLLERYFMGVKPHHLFEIEGLSADPREAGKNIGLVLLYEALRFIRDDRINRFFPVTHIVSQAASYITKRLLTSYFEFRYHGKNEFLNEHFLETIDTKIRTQFLQVITHFIIYIQLFIRNGLSQMRKWFNPLHKESDKTKAVLDMLRDVIQLYQLYYVLIKTGNRDRQFNCHSQDPLTQFATLFKSIVILLQDRREYSSLREYFANNIKNIPKELEPIDTIVKSLEKSIYTKSAIDINKMGNFKDYGFLIEPQPYAIKVIRSEGYEVFYRALTHMIILGNLLQIETDASFVLNIVNDLVSTDVKRRFNYDIPKDQLEAIYIITTIRNKSLLKGNEAEINALSQLNSAIKEKENLIDANLEFNAYFTSTIYEVPPKTTSGFDSYLSLAHLEENWSNIESRVFERIQPQNKPPLIEICEISVIASPPSEFLLLPETLEEYDTEINTLFDILILRPRDETMVSFHGHEYTLIQLEQHLNRLVNGRTTLALLTQEEKVIEMIVEEQEAPYKLEHFIDNTLLSDITSMIL